MNVGYLSKMKASELIIGIDLGETTLTKGPNGKRIEFPRAMEVISYLVRNCRGVYIVSKVNKEQKQRALNWMFDNDFFRRTGIRRTEVHFCAERNEKGPIVKDLRINCFIDDRPEVMAWMPKNVTKILFRPIFEDIGAWNQQDAHVVNSWTEVETLILGGNKL